MTSWFPLWQRRKSKNRQTLLSSRLPMRSAFRDMNRGGMCRLQKSRSGSRYGMPGGDTRKHEGENGFSTRFGDDRRISSSMQPTEWLRGSKQGKRSGWRQPQGQCKRGQLGNLI